ncbi:MinD/ParA family protein [Vulcanococcus limneticus]|uniref:MinD/ParA family ATP-binding protein n=1 Tax=Vulcanococcus limneticus TaxID=2170428 RepID=UPI000B99CA2C|nr:MinD/ParA family protein [Vulcanococcus limneticus]MCP9792068.1 MinD/ParA family protein [Vulcanococcus limneticus MW73D5]MCP9893875.1 MinD/ParA family protein [Vulcanococcus limneticus Candia 3F8]MCP9897518.1 MinD/ParA family protein [Vulcanococcus limneticus Candia 3B3]
MAHILAIHSFRGGTGKSNLTANLAAAFALKGKRVAVIDTDLASPGIHVLFGFTPAAGQFTLNDHLQADASIEQCAHDVTPRSVQQAHGQIWLVPAAMDGDRIARLLREGYEVEKLNDALFTLSEKLKLDLVLIDTHPGINEETLLSTAIADCLLMVMRPDSQDYLGTAVAIEVAQRLDVPAIRMVVNKLPELFDPQQVRERVASSYGVPIGALLPLSDDLLTLASGGLAVLMHPDHPWSEQVRGLASHLLETVL